MQLPRPKVFGIGFHKTGTKSLAEALKLLGYRVTGPNGVDDANISANILNLAMGLATRYDAFQDNPWPLLYREMDQLYPGSKFVLTTRPVDKWYASALRFFGAPSTPMRRLIYGAAAGSPLGNEAIYKAHYLRHHEAVLAHFANRPDQLLVLDLTKGDGWDALCGFLGQPVPAAPFPDANANPAPKSDPDWWTPPPS